MLSQILNNCTVEKNVVKLPEGQLDRRAYVEVKSALEGIGGKWVGGKVSGFVFPQDPTDRLNEIRGGKKVNLKKDFQFFATPDALADRLVEMAELEGLREGDKILEPSAGSGAIIDSIIRKMPTAVIDYCEIMPENIKILHGKYEYELGIYYMCADFLQLKKQSFVRPGDYSRIVSNPPFTKNQDIDHVLEMWEHLAPGGILVSIMSQHWYHSSNKKEFQFSQFVEKHKGEILLLGSGEFKESGTMVPSLIVKLRKEVSNG